MNQFPIETWRHIIRLATLVPGALDTSIDSTLPPYDPSPEDSLFVETNQVKSAASLVSKAWRNIALESLLEFMFIEIDELLERRAVVPFPASLHHVRLLAVRDKIGSADALEFSAERHTRALVSIFRHCSKLTIFTDRPGCFPPSLIQDLVAECGHSLRNIVFGNFLPLPPLFPELFSGHCPNLASLSVMYTESNVIPAETVISLPALHTLRLHVLSTFGSLIWDLPHLRRLELSPLPSEILLDILKIFGGQLTTLRFAGSSAGSMQSILELCPNLQLLDLGRHRPTDEAWVDIQGPFPSLREVRLQCWAAGDGRVDYKTTHAKVALQALTVRETFPSLLLVGCDFFRGWASQIVSEGCQAWWTEVTRRVQDHGMRLEPLGALVGTHYRH